MIRQGCAPACPQCLQHQQIILKTDDFFGLFLPHILGRGDRFLLGQAQPARRVECIRSADKVGFFGTAMIIARCYLDPGALETIARVIPELPEAIRPTHFSESEEKNDPRFPLSGVGAR